MSEVLALTANHIGQDEQVIIFRTLKQHQTALYRSVPVPSELVKALCPTGDYVFNWRRTQAWHHVKAAMAAADITGPQACPRGLRHSFAVHAIMSGVPMHLVQRWLGHTKLETTAIYANAIGQEERQIAKRMW